MATNFPGALDSYAALVDGTDILEVVDQNNVRDAIEALEAKVGINSSAVATSHDYKIDVLEGGVVIASGATVFNTTFAAGSTFQDLDLSGTVGSSSALVILEVRASGSLDYTVKPKGFGSATYAHHIPASHSGASAVSFNVNPNYSYFTVATNSSGVIQHAGSNNTTTCTIKIVSYIK